MAKKNSTRRTNPVFFLRQAIRHYQAQVQGKVDTILQGYVPIFADPSVSDNQKAQLQLLEKKTPTTPCCMHQRRIKGTVKAIALARLEQARLWAKSYTLFDDIYADVNNLIGSMPGIGQLTVYDASIRIAYCSGALPTSVYVHNGTLLGARAYLGKSAKISSPMPPSAFGPLSVLPPHHIENFLCIYHTLLCPGGMTSPVVASGCRYSRKGGAPAHASASCCGTSKS